MLNLAEFIAAASELQALGWAADSAIQKHVSSTTSKKDAIAYANQIADEYDDEYDVMFTQGTINVIAQTADHYNNTLHLGTDVNQIVSDVQAVMYTERFFGATLERRRLMNQLRLRRQIRQTAAIGPEKLGGLFTDPVPFGAYNNVSKRMLLGTMVNAEHKTAQAVAKEGDVPFIRWTLSHKHEQEDDCDVLANAVNDDVQAYLDEHNLDIDPTGLYFTEEVPPTPHPNCQCELVLVTEDGTELGEAPQSHIKRALHVIQKLLQQIRKK